MSRDRFTQIVGALGKALGIELNHDANYTTKFVLDRSVRIFLRHVEEKHQIELIAELGTVPPGKGRELILTEALKINGIFPQVGIMSYAPPKNSLILWGHYPDYSSYESFYSQFIPFSKRALLWNKALQAGFNHPDYSELLSIVPRA